MKANYTPAKGVPYPRDVSLRSCIAISLYGSIFFLFFIPWMKLDKLYYRIEIPSIFFTLLFLHFTIMYKRQRLFSWGASLVKSPPMRFFEFPFGGAIGIPYVVLLLIVPISTGLLPVKDISELTQNHSLLMYFLLCGGGIFIILTMSVLDVYPVNTFGTKDALQRLIEIT